MEPEFEKLYRAVLGSEHYTMLQILISDPTLSEFSKEDTYAMYPKEVGNFQTAHNKRLKVWFERDSSLQMIILFQTPKAIWKDRVILLERADNIIEVEVQQHLERFFFRLMAELMDDKGQWRAVGPTKEFVSFMEQHENDPKLVAYDCGTVVWHDEPDHPMSVATHIMAVPYKP